MKTRTHFPNLEPWLRRLPFIAFNLVAVGLAFALLSPFLSWAFSDRTGLDDRGQTLARYLAIAAQEKAVGDLARRVDEANANGDLIEGASAGVVTAVLQSRLKTLGDAAGVSIQSIQALPLKSIGAPGRESARGGDLASSKASVSAQQLFGARIAFSGTLPATQSLIQSIESGTPLMLITSATLSKIVDPAAESPSHDPLIQAELDVYGGGLVKDRP